MCVCVCVKSAITNLFLLSLGMTGFGLVAL